MADRLWSYWNDEVLPEVPGCPEALAAKAIRRAAIKFCTDSKAFTLESDLINLVANTKEYAWVNATYPNVRASLILQVWNGSYELTPRTRDELKRDYPNWTTARGTPEVFHCVRPDLVRLVPYPIANATAALSILAAVTPLETAIGLVDYIADQNFEAIGFGAKHLLMRVPGKPYSNAQMAAYYDAKFETAISDANFSKELGRADQDLVGRAGFF